MNDFLLYIVKHIVDNPSDVRIEEIINTDGSLLYTIHAKSEDVGKVIGKEGRTINAIRDIIKIKAMQENTYVEVTVAEA